MDLQEKYNLIKQAIQEKKPCHAVYDDLPREFCPYELGTKLIKGYIQRVLACQYGGESSQGLKGGGLDWRCWDLEKLDNIEIKEGEWYLGYKKHSKRKSPCIDNRHFVVDLTEKEKRDMLIPPDQRG